MYSRKLPITLDNPKIINANRCATNYSVGMCFKTGNDVTMMWVKGHIGAPGNGAVTSK